jgi:hypothetical protein
VLSQNRRPFLAAQASSAIRALMQQGYSTVDVSLSYVCLLLFICLSLSSFDRAIFGSARQDGSIFVLALSDPCNELSTA